MWVVSFYEVDRHYGGPEEGGWWYDSGELVRVFKTVPTEDEAYELAFRANMLLNTFQQHKPSTSSMAYNGGRYEADVHWNKPPEHYPETKPHYC